MHSLAPSRSLAQPTNLAQRSERALAASRERIRSKARYGRSQQPASGTDVSLALVAGTFGALVGIIVTTLVAVVR